MFVVVGAGTGSSLTVMSGLRFVRRAAAQGRPVVIVNRGRTRGDALIVDAGCSAVLSALADSCGETRVLAAG